MKRYTLPLFLRNPEIRRGVLLFGLLALAGGLLGLTVSLRFAAGVFCGVLLGGVLCGVLTFRRYRRIWQLSAQLDAVLRGEDGVLFADCGEGDLAVLQTELRKILIRLRSQRDQLADERGKLSAAMEDISHQLRTPLTSMNLTLELLRDPSVEPERRAKLLRDLRGTTGRIDRLCVLLLKLARLDSGTVRFRTVPTDLRMLVNQAAEPLAVPMDLRGQRLLIEGDASAPIDAVWMLEAVSNLLKNCSEHTPESGEIRVTLTQNPIFAEITVEDNGPGFLPDELPHIFERFYRGSGSKEGFGIGLALARSVFVQQNGTLTAENRTSGGARFVGKIYFGQTV